MTDTPDRPRKRIVIDAPSEAVILAARHLDATEGPVQVGRYVDASTRSAITTVLRYIAKAYNSPAVEPPTLMSEVECEEIKARWQALHGQPGRAHHVEELKPEEPQ